MVRTGTMAKNSENLPALAIRSNGGVELWKSPGFKLPYVPDENFPRDESKFCRAIAFSPEGRFFAWGNGANIQLCSTIDWKKVCTLPRPKVFAMKFSPQGTYIMTWEIFSTTKDNPEGSPNLYIYKSDSGEEVFSVIQKKQTDWEPFWTSDETILCIMLGGEVLFYEINTSEGFKTATKKLGGGRNGKFSMSLGNKNYYAFYVPGAKGAPSMCKLFLYPTVNSTQAITCKSFFQADKVEMLWNKKGTELLLLTSTDIDQTGASYYGKQALHFMSTTKGDSFSVSLSKEGPIHAVEWSPKSNEFCVIYGYMPASATIFNLKCDSVHEFEAGPKNSIYYNGFGTILLLAGFGNLRGNIEVWDVAKKNLITTIKAPDSTYLEWHPRGDMFITATTAPRLRMSNGFKIWHYSGALLHETLWPQEMYEVLWQKYPDACFKEPFISSEKVEGIQSSVPVPSAQVYRPPNVRLGIEIPDDPVRERPRIPGLFPTSADRKADERKNRTKSKRDFWSKKKTPNKDENNFDKPGSANNEQNLSSNDNNQQISSQNYQRRANNRRNNQSREGGDVGGGSGSQGGRGESKTPRGKSQQQNSKSTGDPEKDKRIKVIQRKLQDIAKLKGRQDKGEHLEVNQISKISTEIELIKEMKQLNVSA